MANRVDPDMALYEPSHLDLHCLQNYVLVWKVKNVKQEGHDGPVMLT